MILSGREILTRIDKEIFINPFSKNKINPNSYNLSLHDELLVYETPLLDMRKENKFIKLHIKKKGMVLYPGRLYLGRTLEYTKTYNFIPMLEGRSSIGRLGLFVHITAGFGDIGFEGYWTLEMSCIQPIKIYPNIEICQIYYHSVLGEYDNYSINSKYQNNNGIQPSLLFKEFNKNTEQVNALDCSPKAAHNQ